MIVVVMGVAGAGKTTVGRLLAETLGADFLDGDDYHPPANVQKMRAGQPLADTDRWPWLERLNRELRARDTAAGNAVLACSALKRAYREVLSAGVPARFVHLSGSREVLAARLAARRGHYMPPALLDSQLATLEPPDDAIVVEIDAAPAAIAAAIVTRLQCGEA